MLERPDIDVAHVATPPHWHGLVSLAAGLPRSSGHVGFLGHRSIVEFRNIRIRELRQTPGASSAPRR